MLCNRCPVVILLDTYNAVHAGLSMGGAMADLTVRGLCRWLDTAPSLRHAKITLVIDGRPKPDEPSPNEFPSLSLRYSGAGISADHVITQLVERSKPRKQTLVVTNDRAVQAEVRSLGARVQSCEGFLIGIINRRPPPPRRPPGETPEKTAGTATPGEAERWLHEFGLTPQSTPDDALHPPPEKDRPGPPKLSQQDIDALKPEDFHP